MIVALPDANQTFREITFDVVASGVESDVKPRVFFRSFPNRVIYVRDVPAGGGWRDVFLADTSQPERDDGVLRRARAASRSTATKQLVQLELTDGTWHTTYADKPDEYEGSDVRAHRHRPRSDDGVPAARRRKGDAR